MVFAGHLEKTGVLRLLAGGNMRNSSSGNKRQLWGSILNGFQISARVGLMVLRDLVLSENGRVSHLILSQALMEAKFSTL